MSIPKVTEREMALAIEALWSVVCANVNSQIQDALVEEHPIIGEIEDDGVDGPLGMGLRKYGGHCV